MGNVQYGKAWRQMGDAVVTWDSTPLGLCIYPSLNNVPSNLLADWYLTPAASYTYTCFKQ